MTTVAGGVDTVPSPRPGVAMKRHVMAWIPAEKPLKYAI
jgi:hypothetical protein